MAENTKRSKSYRKRTYSILTNTINDNELKNFSKIIESSGQLQGIFNIFNSLGGAFEDVIAFLYPKKDNLEELMTSHLKKLKDSLEKFLSIKTTVSEMMHQLLLDYQNDENSIKTDENELKSHVEDIYNKITEKSKEAEKLKNDIYSIYNNF
ncbi:virulence associated lipoprotein [Borreliella lanei]|uniref:ArsR family metal-binding transcriptional regulator n=1 Tax=Borreliella lanei TaxID=373540 RepID=A0A7W9ZBH4_9SPIR|nr:virulence associated lipoprotein [Borreliella lanei]MBB6208391.1 ArsR family metal-binding transcriptional regulator [Borreliella lanei]MBB6208416.1 ArsR family metal-binding transcriptional regulator [Borreliella lanei]WKC85791.1 virulence associated lipoprotein [Borreliella lanei]